MARLSAVLLSAACAGCQWTGFGFHADGPEMQRLTQALALEAGSVVADVGAGKGQLTAALAAEVQATSVIVLMPPLEVCLRRAAGREPRVPSVIRRWYAEFTPLDRDQLIEPGAVPAW